MAACKSVVVLCPNARRQTVKVGPTTTILQILEEACKKQGLSSQEYAIKYQRKILDETLPIRYSGLSNNAHLELVQQTKTVKEGAQCTIALQLTSGERLVKDFPPTHSLWDVILHWNSQEESPHHQKLFGDEGQDVVCVYMTQRVSGESTLKGTTLHSLGLTGKRAIIRLVHEKSSKSKPEPVPVVCEKPSTISQEKVSSESPVIVTISNTTGMESPASTPSSYTQAPSVNTRTGDRHRSLDSGTVSPERAAKDSKRTRIAGPDPLFPDFKFPEKAIEKKESLQTQVTIVTEERLQYLSTPCERCPIVFKEDDHTVSVTEQGELPDSFYDVTVEDLRKMLQDLKSEKTKSEEMPLLTKAMRESRQLEEMCKYEKVVIRIKFPDRLMLQGFFRPQEKVSVLSEFVKSHLEDQKTSFYLYTTPPKAVLKDQDSTLYNVHLCPASLVYFGSREKKDHFLASHLLSNLASALDAEKTVLDSGIHSSSASTKEPSVIHTTNNAHSSTNTNSKTDNDDVTSAEPCNKPPPPSGGKVPKWFKGAGK